VLLAAAVLGVLVSAYLALVDLVGGATLCLAGSDCDVVRASNWGHVAGLPVAVLGVVYFMAVFGIAGTLASWRQPVLQVLGGVGIGAAVLFVGLQGLLLRAWCPYCLLADMAALAIGLRVLWPGRPGHPAGRLMRGGVGVALAVAVLVAGYAVTPPLTAGAVPGSISPDGASPSGLGPDRLAALADHLRASGGVVYGAYWCPHCQEQKQAFGDAAARLPYVECDPRGDNGRPDLCQAAGVRAYPTWAIGGQKLEGVVSPAELARLSGFDR
jgi:uncharacterized membrane protein